MVDPKDVEKAQRDEAQHKEFCALSTHDRLMIVNALKIAGGEFGSCKVTAEDRVWTKDYRALVRRLHPWPWAPGDKRPACKHGCVPAWSDKGRAQSCWECDVEIEKSRAEAAEAKLAALSAELEAARKELVAVREREKYCHEITHTVIPPNCRDCGKKLPPSFMAWMEETSKANETKARLSTLSADLRNVTQYKLDAEQRADAMQVELQALSAEVGRLRTLADDFRRDPSNGANALQMLQVWKRRFHDALAPASPATEAKDSAHWYPCGHRRTGVGAFMPCPRCATEAKPTHMDDCGQDGGCNPECPTWRNS